jgi:soluble lytic murein transglycosylase
MRLACSAASGFAAGAAHDILGGVSPKTRQLTRLARWLALLLALGAVGSAALVYARWKYREQRWNAIIEQAAARHNVDKFLVKAVMRQESGFDPFAYSHKGAIGLMQVTEAAGLDWARGTGRANFTRESLWDPAVNIEAGTWYLARGLHEWRRRGVDDPVPFALAQYNAGPGTMRRWVKPGQTPTATEFVASIDYPGVRHYIEKVTGYYQEYRERGKL